MGLIAPSLFGNARSLVVHRAAAFGTRWWVLRVGDLLSLLHTNYFIGYLGSFWCRLVTPDPCGRVKPLHRPGEARGEGFTQPVAIYYSGYSNLQYIRVLLIA